MNGLWFLIFALAAGTLAIRAAGFAFARSLPRHGSVVRALNALPGTLIAALLAVLLTQGEFAQWIAAALAMAVAVITRSLPLTMLAGIGALWALRSFAGI